MTADHTRGPAVSVGAEAAGGALPVLGEVPLVERLLLEQQELTAVEQFSRDMEHSAAPSQAQYYSRLLPGARPAAGQQYGFEVDLDRCSGCKACVTACHSLNGLDDGETWRDVGLLVGGSANAPVMQHVTTACHHCLEPACLSACPVDAYEKDPGTGIVRHLDDQCFGCQYCTLACPYDVPRYNPSKGIVRKCDMCADRLSAGEAPACVQACPHEAISIRVVDIEEVRENAEADPFLPAAPEPSVTLPTTSFRTSRVFPRNMLPADYHAVHPQAPHWPLIAMLVLTQLSVGAFAVGAWLERQIPAAQLDAFRPTHALLALGFGLVALLASTLHLGRPQYAFRAVIGLKHSWLSREIVAFGFFAVAAAGYASSVWLVPEAKMLGSLPALLTVASGVCALVCSGMIYAFTQREYWSVGRVLTRFTLTAAVLGPAITWVSVLIAATIHGDASAVAISQSSGRWLLRVLVVATTIKLVSEILFLRHLTARRMTPLKRSALLLVGPLLGSTLARFALGIVGGVFLPVLLILRFEPGHDGDPVGVVVIVAAAFVACLAGEVIERYQFFAAVSSPRMPGNVRR